MRILELNGLERKLRYSVLVTLPSGWLLLGIETFVVMNDRLCGLVVRVLGYGSGGLGSIPGTTREKSSGSGTGSTQPREYN
jgi:hypothetical protein